MKLLTKSFIFKCAVIGGGILFTTVPSTMAASSVTILGTGRRVIEVTPEKNTGLDAIFVAFSVNDCEVRYEKSSSSNNIKWYKYSNLGGGFAEEINSYDEGNFSVLKYPEGDKGYIVEDGDKRYYFWLVDYSAHRFIIRSLQPSDQQDCDHTLLTTDGSGDAIHYFTINGQQRTLSREIEVSYMTLEWDESNKFYNQIEKSSVFESLTELLTITPAVLCNTDFYLTGDRFLKDWGEETYAKSSDYQTNAVALQTSVFQSGIDDVDTSGNGDEEDNGNEGNGDEDNEDIVGSDTPGSNIIRSDSSGLGGSAPAEITFQAYTTDAVLHNEWQMASDSEFNNILYRFNVQDLTYTFNEEGTFYVRFIGSNSDGSCEAISDTYEVIIGASDLLCPNAFSPDGDGINDEWKVSYRSLIDFKCWIFDRYGRELYHFDNPSLGWDGKFKDKVVKPGVYYYVIQATGADGKKYKKSGDINILRRNISRDNSSTTE